MRPANGALPLPDVCIPERVIRGALVSRRYSFTPLRCRLLSFARSILDILSISVERSQ